MKYIVRQSVKYINFPISKVFTITHWNKAHESQCPSYFLD